MCKPEFYFPDPFAETKYFNGSDIEREYFKRLKNQTNEYDNAFLCLPCRKGCNECDDDSACVAEYDILMRGIPLGIQSFCMTITLVLGVIIVRLRKTKVISHIALV